MPIDIETFEEESGFDGEEPLQVRILRFLAQNDDKAFTRSEIAEATEIEPNSVSAILSRLKKQGLARHKPPYWALGERERIRTATDLHTSIAALDEQLGSEDMEAWRDAGADEPHPNEQEDDA